MRLIDADALPTDDFLNNTKMVLQSDIDSAPTIDAVPVVRCKDCKHYWKNYTDDDSVPVCLASPKDDAFCSEGERKDDVRSVD